MELPAPQPLTRGRAAFARGVQRLGSQGKAGWTPFSGPLATTANCAKATAGVGRKPAVADHDLGRLNWADSGPTRVASEGPESAAKPPFRCECEIGFTVRSGHSLIPPLHARDSIIACVPSLLVARPHDGGPARRRPGCRPAPNWSGSPSIVTYRRRCHALGTALDNSVSELTRSSDRARLKLAHRGRRVQG
jgi:hypothetical protein